MSLHERAQAAVDLEDTPVYDRLVLESYEPAHLPPVRSATSEPAPLWVYVVLALIALFAVAVVVL